MEREKERWRERERRSEREGESGLSLMVVLTAASPPTGSNTINPPKQSQRERRKLARNKEINLTTLKYTPDTCFCVLRKKGLHLYKHSIINKLFKGGTAAVAEDIGVYLVILQHQHSEERQSPQNNTMRMGGQDD